jgi:hypothetical protein
MGPTQTLKESLETFNLQTLAANPHKFSEYYPQYNPLDVYRAHLANTLSDVTGVAAGTIYPSLQWTQSLAKGDMVLPVPALRVKGGKPTDLALDWAKQVNFKSCSSDVGRYGAGQPLMSSVLSSFLTPLLWKNLLWTVLTYNFSLNAAP